MKPVTIRYYGLIHIRKQTYLVLQTIVLAICGIWVLFGMVLVSTKPHVVTGDRPFGLDLWDFVLLLGVFVTIAEILDTIFTLRAFRRQVEKEESHCEAEPVRARRTADSNIKKGEDRFRQRM